MRQRERCADCGHSLVRGPIDEVPTLCCTWGSTQPAQIFGVGKDLQKMAGFPAVVTLLRMQVDGSILFSPFVGETR
jgi:hypothetical protein